MLTDTVHSCRLDAECGLQGRSLGGGHTGLRGPHRLPGVRPASVKLSAKETLNPTFAFHLFS